jgi:SAM-dependent methyltransferase
MSELIWEERVYAKGKHLNRYPFGELVSLFFNARSHLRTDVSGSHSLLELGCGAGNNLWFFAENGLDCVGIDASDTACKIARERMLERGVSAVVLCMNFDQIDEIDRQFDFIVDRAATYCGDFETRQRWWRKALRCLKPGGIVISVNFDKSSVWYQKSVNEPGFAKKVSTDTFSDFAYGPLVDTGISHFVDLDSLLLLFEGLETLNVLRHQCSSVYHSDHLYNYSELVYIGRKGYV